MHSAKVAAQIRVQIRRFSGEFSRGLPKTAGRLVREVIYGVQSRGSVRLSEIARALEEKIRLKKIMARLSRQLNRRRLRQRVRENLLIHQAEFSTGRHSATEVRAVAQSGDAGSGDGLLRQCVPG